MAISTSQKPDISNTSGVVKVSDPANYLNEMFDTAMDPSVPSFATFLKDYRGIDISMFSKEALTILALIMETTVYSQFCAMVKQAAAAQNAKNGAPSSEEEQLLNWVAQTSPDEVKAAIDAMQMRTQQLKDAFSAKVASGA